VSGSADLVAAGNVCAGAMLVVAAAGKVAAPRQLASAVAELGRPWASWATRRNVRAAGAIEMAAGLALALPVVRLAGAALVVVLGVAFATLGLAGARRAGELPCGCLGSARGRPLGAVNVLVGLVLVALAIGNFALADGDLAGWADGSGAVGVAVVALAWMAALQRQTIRAVLRRSAIAGEGAASIAVVQA
jgi:hypothetical protein